MPANTQPIYTLTPKLGSATWLAGTTANVKSDGAGTIATDILLVMTAGSAGSFLNRVRLSAAGTTASTSTTATVGRLFLSTQSAGATTSTNTKLIAEIALASQTTDQPTVAIPFVEIPLGFYIPSTQSLLFSMHHAAAANTLWHAVCFYGDY